MGTAQSSPKHERPAGAFFSCPCLRAGCSALRGLCRPCWLPLWRLRLPLRRGEARRKRSADEEEAAAAPVASVLPYGFGLGYHGLGYAGLGYHGLGYPYAVAAPAPVEVEAPVTQYKYVPEVKTVEPPPACQNAFGFAVPCA